jgi:hypothetical protein
MGWSPLVDDNDRETGEYWGDEVQDLVDRVMDGLRDKVNGIYESYWGRKATEREFYTHLIFGRCLEYRPGIVKVPRIGGA